MPVRAVTPVSYDDPAGDQLDPRPSMDILKVSWSVTPASNAARPRLVVEMTLAAPPEERLVNYTAVGDAGRGCKVDVSYHPGTVFSTTGIEPTADFSVVCQDPYEAGALWEARLELKGNVITMSTPLDSVTKLLRETGTLTGLVAMSGIGEPITGQTGTAQTGAAADTATTDQTFRYS